VGSAVRLSDMRAASSRDISLKQEGSSKESRKSQLKREGDWRAGVVPRRLPVGSGGESNHRESRSSLRRVCRRKNGIPPVCVVLLIALRWKP